MATLEQIRNTIGEVLQDTAFMSVSVSSVTSVINDVVNYFKFRRYWFNETEADLTATVGNPVLSGMPSDFLREIEHGGLTIRYSNIVYPLKKISTESYDKMDNSGLGLPRFYTYRNNRIELYPYPSDAYTVRLRYLKDYAELSLNSDSNDFTSNADRLVRYEALARIYAEYKQDDKMESYYTARSASEENNLLKRSNALSGSGSLVKDSFLL